ncbi:MAG: DUF2075 domain-containing protein [Anaerococcus prevotii]|uniref:DUF2075 domain-containing protein n=1 Tax=Anaerococcus prevotii TaxID=33034 RepID=UPI0028FE6BD1|nr:DUF2075 domain-containing protein [Anaerococcus prevotii]MDU2558528.1 DUF2075 domain-containing protein [Anaerococcus prevotii]
MTRENLYYEDYINNFLNSDNDYILGKISNNNSSAETRIQQKNTWIEEIQILKRELNGLDGRVIFEYTIPRMGKRVDNIILHKNIVFVLEFKCGSEKYSSSDYDQVYDYALDLKNFHKASFDKLIVPILIATDANYIKNDFTVKDDVMVPLKCNRFGIRDLILDVSNKFNLPTFSYDDWIHSEYLPTPTIVEAAQALYTGHNVDDITRNDAGIKNITITTDSINKIIEHSKRYNRKSVCFVTGVPGAGKTLVGLNLGIQKADAKKGEHAVFLSGNFPLVEVLQEALVRDRIKTMKKLGLSVRKSDERRKTNSFIQIIHKYRDSFINNDDIPPEHIVIFDEAQRSWNHSKIAKFMKTKKGIADFSYSEPEFLISTMDRHKNWAVVVCLIGGGQEINDGEGGLPERFDALRLKFRDWSVYVSSNLKDEYLINNEWKYMTKGLNVNEIDDLHLSVSLRSFRSPDLTEFIKSMLDIDIERSKNLYNKIKERYPIKITRDLEIAKDWVKNISLGSQKYGLLAASGALRLKAEGIFVKNDINVCNWFLNEKEDVRSCYALEDVVTEFDIQGLEVDYSLVCWDADFRFVDGKWEYKKFRGSKWINILKSEDQLYLKNTYRVLLTRARQGMVIFVPSGCYEDITRKTKFYDGTYNYLKTIGIEEI